MSAHHDNHDPATLDDLHDRLVDRGLAELIGREAPPDLRERILAASVPAKAANIEAPRTRSSRAFWASLATAAMLLVGTSILFVSSVNHSRDFAAASAKKRSSHRVEISPFFQHAQSEVPTPAQQSAGNQYVEAYSPHSEQSYATTFRNRSSQVSPAEPGTKEIRALLSKDNSGTGPESSVQSQLELEPTYAIPSRSSLAITNPTDGVSRYSSDLSSLADNLATVADSGANEWAHRPDALYAHSESQLQARGGIYGGEARGVYFDTKTAEGTGPGLSGDQYTRIVENPFVKAEGGAAVSTFSIDVDTASYANVRQFLMQMNTLPPPDAVRIEELINYFDYNYAPPTDAVDIANAPPAPGSAGGSNDPANSSESAPAPFAAHVEVAGCPWAPEHRLVRVGIKGRELDRNQRPKSNLVFLVDVSGSMDEPAKLPLVSYGLQQLTRELGENDRVAIVVYASSEGLVLPSTPGTQQDEILAALGRLQAGGSTAGGAGIQLAYQLAEDNFIEGGTNRVILCTDGDFNVGVTSTAELERMVEQKAKDTGVFLSVLGFGRGNLNDAMMEAISNHGNGNYHYVDNRTEARRVLVEEMTGTLVTIAKDVKIQVEFNPRQVAGYRLIGYENRLLRSEDFNDDRKDAGEIGAGHTVTALYEIVPAGKSVAVGPVDDLKYQQPAGDTTRSRLSDDVDAGDDQPSDTDIAGELLTLKMRYKQPDGDTSRKLEWPITDDGQAFSAATADFQFAAAVASFGLLLRNSQYKGNLTYAAALEMAQQGVGADEHGYRTELLDMIRRAKMLRGE